MKKVFLIILFGGSVFYNATAQSHSIITIQDNFSDNHGKWAEKVYSTGQIKKFRAK